MGKHHRSPLHDATVHEQVVEEESITSERAPFFGFEGAGDLLEGGFCLRHGLDGMDGDPQDARRRRVSEAGGEVGDGLQVGGIGGREEEGPPEEVGRGADGAL